MIRSPRRSWSFALTIVLGAGLALAGPTALAQSPAPSEPACTPLPPLAVASPAPAELGEVTVFAAASLRDSFTIMGQAWAARNPGSSLTFSFDSSSALRAQIEEAAPADVFASADLRNPQTLVDTCLAPAPITVFASNQAIIVTPADNPAGIDSWDDLAAPGVRVVAAGEEVPIQRYAEQILTNLAALPDAPEGFLEAVHANYVSREDNVAAVLAKIELGEGDAGIVYVTDAAGSDGVATVDIPAEGNVLASYGAVSVGMTDSPDGAAAFLAYLTGPEAQAILAQHGFLPPSP
ncbi:MAG: molybdate ABC transporter substrate-binding protein [Chloroflexi bacterium]|nr:molybdate ABC transporter substrate-binding protein [Chloroflexota bacterium]